MKLPADSKVRAWDAARARDKASLALLAAKDEPFTVPAFCRALQAILDLENSSLRQAVMGRDNTR